MSTMTSWGRMYCLIAMWLNFYCKVTICLPHSKAVIEESIL